MTYTYTKITNQQLPLVWLQVSPLIQRAIDAGFDKSSVEFIRRGILKGQLHLFVVSKETEIVTVAVTSFLERPMETIFCINLLAGKDLDTAMKEFWPTMIQWAKENGASKVEAICHPKMFSLMEKYNFTSKQVVATLEI